MNNNIIKVENTQFIFRTNFAGNPEYGYRGSTERTGCILVDEDMAIRLRGEGVDVKQTKPSDTDDADTYIPKYYVNIKLKYNPGSQRPPKVYLVTNDVTTLLDEDELTLIDEAYVERVDVTLATYQKDEHINKKTLYIRVMYVVQALDTEEDPWGSLYRVGGEENTELPFDN